MRPPVHVAIACALVLVAGCGEDRPSAEQVFLEDARSELDALLGEEAPDYTDEELLAYGERACSNLEDVPSGDDLRRTIEAASVGSSETGTVQIAQATVLVTSAARHLCPDEGGRLGLLEDGASA